MTLNFFSQDYVTTFVNEITFEPYALAKKIGLTFVRSNVRKLGAEKILFEIVTFFTILLSDMPLRKKISLSFIRSNMRKLGVEKI